MMSKRRIIHKILLAGMLVLFSGTVIPAYGIKKNEPEPPTRFSQMLNAVEDVVVLDSLVVPADSVLRYIRLHPSCGQLKKSQTSSSETSKRPALLFDHISEKGDRYLSSQSKTSATDRKPYLNLYSYDLLLDGWEALRMDDNINPAGSNQCNAYLMSDGVTVYFASDAEGGLGGYDLYASRYNANIGGYFRPEPLPLPFNSEYDDLLYIIDEQARRGYLVSDRQPGSGMLTIYIFQPNRVRRILRGLEDKSLERRAKLTCIADTWNGLNVDSVLQAQEKVYQETHISIQAADENEEKNPGFRIQGDLVYQNSEDFQSEDAKALFLEYCDKKLIFNQLESNLVQLRQEYSEAGKLKEEAEEQAMAEEEIVAKEMAREAIQGAKETMKELSSKIVDAESEVLELQYKLEEMEKQIRQKEYKALQALEKK